MIKTKYLAGALLVTMALASCDDETLSIGSSLTNDNDILSLSSAVFYTSTDNYVAGPVVTHSSDCYLGKVKDPLTKTEVESSFTTQFHLLKFDETAIGPYDGRDADSCELVIYMTQPFKLQDSLTAMKLQVQELAKPAREDMVYYTDFDPTPLLRTTAGGINVSKMFTYKNLENNDANSSYNYVRIALNAPYVNKGKTYTNYGSYILQRYHEDASLFRNSFVFADSICPGFAFSIADGLGLYTKVSDIGLRIYYTLEHNDSTYHPAMTIAGTREVLQTTTIKNDQQAINALADSTAFTYLKSPAGLFTEVEIPVEAIKSYTDANGNHANDSLLATKITFQRLNELSSDYRMFAIPQTLLMVPKDSVNTFFENKRLPDSRTSYYTSYDSSNNTYTFSNISNLVNELWALKQSGATLSADWNKMVLIPVTYTTQSSTSTLATIDHNMGLTSTRLIGGKANPGAIRIDVVYAKFQNE